MPSVMILFTKDVLSCLVMPRRQMNDLKITINKDEEQRDIRLDYDNYNESKLKMKNQEISG